MELSVEEIIAKVAVQRQKQKQTEKQQQLLKQINCKSIDAKQSRINHNKNSAKQLKSQSTSDTVTVTQKYKQLQAIYKKLKVQVSTELKMDKKYSQLMEKLTKVIEKNSKLQTELDGLRMKQSVIMENEKSLNQENEKKNKSKKWMVTEYREKSVEKSAKKIKSRGSILKCEDRCDCGNRKCIQACIEEVKDQRPSKLKFNKESSAKVQLSNNSTIKKPQVPSSEDLASKILQYKEMILEKQSSIDKLRFIWQKQEELIQQYEAESVIVHPKAGEILSKAKEMKHPSSKKVEGTIVKVNRGNNKQARVDNNRQAITDRQQMFPTSHYYNFLSPGCFPLHQEKTRKKPQAKHLGTNNTLQAKSPSYHPTINQPYTYIESIPSQQQSHPYYLRPSFHSPSSSINETSEFVCGDIQ